MNDEAERTAILRSQVDRLLAASPAFHRLPKDARVQLAHDMIRVAAYLVHGRHAAALGEVLGRAGRPGAAPMDVEHLVAELTAAPTRTTHGKLVEGVDFPAFVEELMKGVFHAIVDASLQQMQAYAEMIRQVGVALDGVDDEPTVDDDDD